MGAYKVACAFATGETEALTLAMDLNPIIMMVTAVGLLGIGLYAAFKHSEDLNDSIAKRNKLAQEAESKTALGALNKAAEAKGDLNYYSTPEYKAAKDAAIKDDLKTNFGRGEYKNTAVTAPVISSQQQFNQLLIQRTEATQKQNVNVTFDNMPKGANVTTDNDLIKVKTTTTLGNFQ